MHISYSPITSRHFPPWQIYHSLWTEKKPGRLSTIPLQTPLMSTMCSYTLVQTWRMPPIRLTLPPLELPLLCCSSTTSESTTRRCYCTLRVIYMFIFSFRVDTAFSVASGGSVSTPTSTSTSSVASSRNIILSVGPSATDRSTGNTTKLPRAQALLHGLVVAVTIVTIIIILFLLILLLKRRRRLNLYRCCRNYRRDKPRTQDMTRTTVIDPFPNVIPATGNLLAPANYSWV